MRFSYFSNATHAAPHHTTAANTRGRDHEKTFRNPLHQGIDAAHSAGAAASTRSVQGGGVMRGQDELSRLRDRCETLIEENRQLKETFAPIRIFPQEWNLRPAHHRILSALVESPNGLRSDAQLRAVACSPDAECETIIKMQISYLRKRLRPHGIEIKTRYGVGYELPPASREIVRAALR